MRVNQQSIAQQLDLSVSTVSRALRNDAAIPAQTRARVIRVASDLGYRLPRRRPMPRPDGSPALRQTTLSVLAHVTDHAARATRDPREAGHFMLTGITAAAARNGLCVLFEGIRDRDETPGWTRPEPSHQPQPPKPAGAVLLYSHRPEFVERLAERVPCVSIVNRYPGVAHDCVTGDPDDAIDAMVEHLYALGHRRVGFVHGESLGTWVEGRYAAYVKALLRRGVAVEPSRIVGVYGQRMPVAQRAHELVAKTQRGVTGWICSNDMAGYDLIGVMRDAQLRVPEDVSVAGFDGVAAPAGMPPLTTISAPLVELGEAAVQRLVYRLENPTASIRTIQLACRLEIGRSTAEAPR